MSMTTIAKTAQNLVGVAYEGDAIIQVKQPDMTLGKIIGPISPLKMAINPGEVSIKTRELRNRGLYGQKADPIVDKTAEPTVALETDDAGEELILLALRATRAAITETGGSAVDTVVPAPFKGSWLQLPHRNISATGFAGKHANDSALVVDADYGLQDIWLQHGLIWIPDTSAIAANEACKWSYVYNTVSGTRLLGNQLAQITLRIEFLGINRVNKKQTRIVIHETTINKSTDLDFAANDYIKPNLSGVMTTPVDKVAPYEIEELTFAP